MAEIMLSNVCKEYPGGSTGKGARRGVLSRLFGTKGEAKPSASTDSDAHTPRYGRAVDEVSIHCQDGSFTVLVGPSGCGKSTTLRMIAGLEDITSGTIAIGGRVVNDVHPKDRDIAMVFQNYALYPHMTVRQNMSFALKLRKVPREEIDRRVLDAARMLGLTELLDRRPSQLSGGQRQRVAVGRAIVREPKAFLFDEPLSNLDAKLRVSTRAELKSLHQRLRTTTVYVTHDQEEAMTLGDTVVVMSRGRVQQVGPPLEVYRRPVNRFVAGFIGTPPMNFLEGRLMRDGSAWTFVEGAADAPGIRVPLGGAGGVGGAGAKLAGASDGMPVVLGVRPQAFELSDVASAESSHPRVALTVRVIEPLGDQMDVQATTPRGTQVVARVSTRDVLPATGAAAAFTIDPSRVHVFAPGEFGTNLLNV
jgi:multiple sugar transport system ATP-binding protein